MYTDKGNTKATLMDWSCNMPYLQHTTVKKLVYN
jgi:hypothetical protein